MTQKVILIYDDELAECIARNVEVNRPYLCLPYTSARKLMEELPQLRFDLFLTDLAAESDSVIREESLNEYFHEHELGIVSGTDLGFKARQLFPKVPIISWSAYNAKQAFSNHHIEKPVSSEELLGTLDDFLRD